jgi:hypothetical protein
MSTVTEIANALAGLDDAQLREVERALHAIYRQRRTGIIYDDAYGVWTEEDQAGVVQDAFALMDRAEKHSADKTKP